jgi:hypothetical protein
MALTAIVHEQIDEADSRMTFNTESQETGNSRSPWHRVFLCLALALGVFLRLYLISGQVLIDDEWHGFYYVIGKKLSYLLTHFSIPGATCIPLHLYYYGLLKTVGWNETLLRLPSLVAGVLSLVLFPFLLRDILTRRALIVFSFLLAISPFLVFYSRFCRPYSPEVLFGFTAIMSAYHWATSGRLRYAILYGIAGALAVYFQLFGVITVVAPALCVLLFKLLQNRLPALTGPTRVMPSVFAIAVAFAVTCILVCALVLPAFIDSAKTSLNTIAGEGAMRRLSVLALIEMLTGTGNFVLAMILIALSIAGLIAMAGKNRLLAMIFIATITAFVAAIAISKPHSGHAAIVVCRYCVPVFPLVFALIAVGLDSLLSGIKSTAPGQARIMCNLLTGLFIAGLLWSGPLRQTYVVPNNFTSHAVFQDSYRPIDWRESFFSEMAPHHFWLDTTISNSQVSAFYDQLATDTVTSAIIEYPMMVGDHFDPYYYYQHFHKKRVLVGYSTTFTESRGLAAGNVFGNTYIDEVLSLVSDKGKLRFRNLVDMDDEASIAGSGAGYAILHRKFAAELWRVAKPPPCIPQLEEKYRRLYGQPVFDDGNMVVFRLRQTR